MHAAYLNIILSSLQTHSDTYTISITNLKTLTTNKTSKTQPSRQQVTEKMTSYNRQNQVKTAAGQQSRSSSTTVPKTAALQGLATSRWAQDEGTTSVFAKSPALKPAPTNKGKTSGGLATSIWAGGETSSPIKTADSTSAAPIQGPAASKWAEKQDWASVFAKPAAPKPVTANQGTSTPRKSTQPAPATNATAARKRIRNKNKRTRVHGLGRDAPEGGVTPHPQVRPVPTQLAKATPAPAPGVAAPKQLSKIDFAAVLKPESFNWADEMEEEESGDAGRPAASSSNLSSRRTQTTSMATEAIVADIQERIEVTVPFNAFSFSSTTPAVRPKVSQALVATPIPRDTIERRPGTGIFSHLFGDPEIRPKVSQSPLVATPIPRPTIERRPSTGFSFPSAAPAVRPRPSQSLPWEGFSFPSAAPAIRPQASLVATPIPRTTIERLDARVEYLVEELAATQELRKKAKRSAVLDYQSGSNAARPAFGN